MSDSSHRRSNYNDNKRFESYLNSYSIHISTIVSLISYFISSMSQNGYSNGNSREYNGYSNGRPHSSSNGINRSRPTSNWSQRPKTNGYQSRSCGMLINI